MIKLKNYKPIFHDYFLVIKKVSERVKIVPVFIVGHKFGVVTAVHPIQKKQIECFRNDFMVKNGIVLQAIELNDFGVETYDSKTILETFQSFKNFHSQIEECFCEFDFIFKFIGIDSEVKKYETAVEKAFDKLVKKFYFFPSALF